MNNEFVDKIKGLKMDDCKNEGNYSLDDLKKNTDKEDCSENSPLKGKKIISCPEMEKSGSEGGAKGLREWLSKSSVKWGIAVLVLIVLLSAVLISIFITLQDDVRLLKLWPQPNKQQNMIHFVYGSSPPDEREIPELIKQLDMLLSRYQPTVDRGRNVVICTDNSPPLKKDNVCYFDIQSIMHQCRKSMNYGYDIGKPCVFLEFNNIKDWVPETYTYQELKKYIDTPDRDLEKLVYLDCQGDTLFDQENMGPIEYTPDRGFPAKYFPYRGQPEYMAPLVGIRFTKPAIGVVISVTCKLWAKNINYADGSGPSGQISFNLLID